MSISFINRKSGGGGDGATLNVFAQLSEPSTKKGIWLQREAEFEYVYADDDVVESESWYPDGTFRAMPYAMNAGSSTLIGTNIYFFGGRDNKAKAYKYDTLTNIYTQLANIPSNNFIYGSVSTVGTDIYLFGGGGYDTDGSVYYTYKYDTLTNTYTQLTNIPNKFMGGSTVAVGTDIYLLGGKDTISISQYNYKYDTLNDTYTRMSNIPYKFSYSSAVTIGTTIYIFGSNVSNYYNKAYKYDTLADRYTQLADIPYDFYNGSASVVGTTVYLFGGNGNKKAVYKYDTLTNTYTQLTNIPYDFYYGASQAVNFKIYLLGGSNSGGRVQCMQTGTKDYENNSVVISQGRLYNVGYATELFSTQEFIVPALYAFADAWFYTTQDGLDGSMPVYYGNGTSWVNIKNPPQ